MSESRALGRGSAAKARSSVLAAGIIAAALGGCASRYDTTGSIPVDYRQRHAIGLTRSNETLDVFVGSNNGRIDRRQQADVQEFARDYMQNGEGPLVAYLPTGGNAHGVNAGLDAIRRSLAGGGAHGRLQIAHYHPENAAATAPIKLAFAKLKAGTATQCGYEAEEIAPSRYSVNAINAPAPNLGCSYQKNLAAQIADPRDLIRPRQEGPIDAEKRLGSIEKLREDGGKDLLLNGKTVKQIVAE